MNHESKLIELCKPEGLLQMGERPNQIRFIFKEPIFEEQYSSRKKESPDLIIGKYDGTYTVAELKRSLTHRTKAYHQIYQGVKTLVDVFGIPFKNITGKLVVYTFDRFKYEVMP